MVRLVTMFISYFHFELENISSYTTAYIFFYMFTVSFKSTFIRLRIIVNTLLIIIRKISFVKHMVTTSF